MKKLLLLIIGLQTLFGATNANAWGKKGHDMVAEIAFKNLDRKTKKLVLESLDGLSIQEAANWMDDMRKDKNYNYMKSYHYINIDKGSEVEEVEGDNILYIVNKTIKELQHKQTLSKEEIRVKVLMLFHLIGDLHQPLHVGYGADKGGNSAQVNYLDKGTNLHALWDFGIIEGKNITLKQCLHANKYSKTEIEQLQEINVLNWAKESRNFLDRVYNTNGNIISDDYAIQNVPIITSQIQKAGIRLAGILRMVFNPEG
jgi:S1/P1 Nuclease